MLDTENSLSLKMDRIKELLSTFKTQDMPKNKMGEIYIVKNLKNNKVYIGQTECVSPVNNRSHGTKVRWVEHIRFAKNGKSGKLYDAIRTEGLENFSCEMLHKIPSEYLNTFEYDYIKIYDSTNDSKGYNINSGGSATDKLGLAIAKSEATKEQWKKSPELKELHSEKAKKQWEDEEFREKVAKGVGEASKKRFESQEYIDNFRNKSSKSHKEKNGRGHLPMYVSERFVNKIHVGYAVLFPDKTAKSFTAKSKTMEEKLKMALEALQKWQTEQINSSTKCNE
jgi:hypothetical protein